jgi:DNA-binding NarL/FixJ family response regulator
MNRDPIRILLVDDHPMLRGGLSRLIEKMPDCQVCGESANAAGAMEMIPRLSPTLVILDISLPDRNGLELLKDLRLLYPDLPVLVFSMHDEMLYAERVIRAGARGYLMKGADAEKLSEAIECVLAGERYLSRKVSSHLLATLSGNRTTNKLRLERLTDRELEIFELIGRGGTNSQIAEKLHISPKTVDAHRSNMKTKLDLPDASGLMREAVLWVELSNRSSNP